MGVGGTGPDGELEREGGGSVGGGAGEDDDVVEVVDRLASEGGVRVSEVEPGGTDRTVEVRERRREAGEQAPRGRRAGRRGGRRVLRRWWGRRCAFGRSVASEGDEDREQGGGRGTADGEHGESVGGGGKGGRDSRAPARPVLEIWRRLVLRGPAGLRVQGQPRSARATSRRLGPWPDRRRPTDGRSCALDRRRGSPSALSHELCLFPPARPNPQRGLRPPHPVTDGRFASAQRHGDESGDRSAEGGARSHPTARPRSRG